MKHQCQARTTSNTRCKCSGGYFARVAYCDGIREFRVCLQHLNSIKQRVFRPAINQPVTRALNPVEKLSGYVAEMIVGAEGKVSG